MSISVPLYMHKRAHQTGARQPQLGARPTVAHALHKKLLFINSIVGRKRQKTSVGAQILGWHAIC
jgi:hypothetical protein